MYEAITYDKLVKEMLDTALAETTASLDTREGSTLWYGVAPAAVELQNIYIQLDWILDQSFADTATRPYLIRRAQERGLYPYEATPSVIRATAIPSTVNIPVDSRFSLGTVNFVVIENEGGGKYQLRCETAGTVGNVIDETLLPIQYIQGLQTLTATEILIPGDDEEDTEHFRTRYLNNLNSQSYGGNIAQYKEWVETIDGTGGCKVYPVWNGGGTVKVVVIDSTYKHPSEELVELVQTTLDPIPNQGQGIGVAPIGHTVTVEGVTESTINILTQLTLAEGFEWDGIKSDAEAAIDEYFTTLAADWANSDIPLTVRISQIEVRLLNINGVIDVADTQLNGLPENVQLGDNDIPIRGTVDATTD